MPRDLLAETGPRDLLATAPVSPAMQVANPSQNWSNIGAESLQAAGIRPALTNRETGIGRLMAAIPFNLGDEFMARAASDPMLHMQTKDQVPYDTALSQARDISTRYSGAHPIESTAISIPGNIAGTAAMPGGPIVQSTAGGALQGFGSGEGENDRLRKALLGGAVSLGTSTLLSGAGKLMSQPKVNPDVKLLQDEGVPLTPGQMGGKIAKKTEDIATSVPVMGDFIAKRQGESIEGLNRAVANRSLSEINQTLPANVAAGRDTVAYVRKAMTDSYTSTLSGMQAKPDMPFSAMLQTAKATAATLPKEQLGKFDQVVNSQIFDKLAKNNGILDGDAIKGVESQLTSEIKGYNSGGWDDQKLASALVGVKTAFRDMITRQNPTLAPQLAATDRAYANYAILRKAGSALGNDNGVFTPSQLLSAVKGADSSAGTGNFASGTARMSDLADAAKNVLPSKFQDSGTVKRLLQGGVLMSGIPAAIAHPLIAAGIGAGVGVGSAAYTTPGQALLRTLMTAQRPGAVAAIGQALKGSTPSISSIIPLLLRHAASAP